MPGVRLDSMTEPAIDCDQAADSSIIADLAWLLPIRVRFLGVPKVESSQRTVQYELNASLCQNASFNWLPAANLRHRSLLDSTSSASLALDVFSEPSRGRDERRAARWE